VTVRIAILVEGRTEQAFKPGLVGFLDARLRGRMPKLVFSRCDGRIPKDAELRRRAWLLRRDGNDAVIALTDVYTGSRDFADAADAKAKMRAWVGDEPWFHPHVAQHEFEAWLLPYWDRIKTLARSDRNALRTSPEDVNHDMPPSKVLNEVFRTGSAKREYQKTLDASRILRDQDLAVAAAACPELKAFLNTVLTLSGALPL
jgi:hypothetical protein